MASSTVEKTAVVKLQIEDGSALKAMAAINKQIDDLKTKQSKLSTNTEVGRVSYVKYEQQIKALQTQYKNYSKEIQQSLAPKQKDTQATIVAASAYEELVSKAREAEITARNLGAMLGQNNPRFQQAAKEAQSYNEQLRILNQTTGHMGQKANSANYSMFTLTQVMRELPNFAIDARLGFMSLSNNLPMLSQGFSDLSKQLGSSKKAFAMMAKSLLSMNTLMVVASTLLVMYGDDLIKMFKATDNARIGHDAFVKSMKEGGNEYTKAIENVIRAESALADYQAGTITATQFLKEYNETLGDVVGNTNDVGVAQTNIVNSSEAYLQAMYGMAEANYVLAEAARSAGLAEMMKNEDPTTFWNALSGAAKQFIVNAKDLKSGGITKAFRDFVIDMTANVTSGTPGLGYIQGIQRLEDAANTGFETFKTLRAKVVAEAKKNKLNLFGGDPPSTTEQSPIDVQREEYNRLAAQLKVVQQELAKVADEEERFGVKTSYEDRIQAANLYATNEEKIAKSIADLDRGKIKAEYLNEKAKLELQAKNAKDKTKAAAELSTALKVLEQNRADALKEVDDTYNATLIEAKKDLKDRLYVIGQDRLKDTRAIIEQEGKAALQSVSDEKTAAILKATEAYNVEFTGAKSYKARRLLKRKHEEEVVAIEAFYNKAALDKKKETLDRLNNLTGLSDADKLANDEKIKALELQITEAGNKAILDANAAKNATLEEQDKQSLENRNAILSEAFEGAAAFLSAYYDNVRNQQEYNQNQELDTLEDLHKRKRISDKKYEVEKKAINKKYFEEEKKLKIQQALIEAALGTIRIWASGSPIPVKIAESIALASITGANIAVIKKTKYAKRGALLSGPSHAAGGIPVEAEGGESIINKKSTSMFSPLLSLINQAGGGVSFANGGMPGLSGDGGYSARALSNSVTLGLSDSQVRAIVESIKVYVAVSDIRKAEERYAIVENNGNF